MNSDLSESILTDAAVEARPSGNPISLRARLPWRVAQAALDFVTVFVAAYAAYLGYLVSGVGLRHYAPEYYARLDVVLASVTTFVLYNETSRGSRIGLLRIEWVCRMLRAVASGVLLILAASFFLHLPSFSRFHMLFAGPVVAFALLGQRLAVWHLQRVASADRTDMTPVLVYGADETGRLLVQHLLEEHDVGLRPCGFLDDRVDIWFSEVRAGPGVHGTRLPVLGGEDHLQTALERTGAKAVFLAMPSASTEKVARVIAKLETWGVPFYAVPNAGDLLFSSLTFGQVGSIPVYTRRVVTSNWMRDGIERAIDLVCAASLLLLTLPLLVVGAVAVRLGSRGPVLFRQTRVGHRGQPFTIYKLRTMRTDAPAYADHPTTAEDPRVTPIGRFLRRSCIDELPQLFNVLLGDMSLVGPRPEMPQIVREYSDIERQRLTVKPGITGLWQISADRAFRIHDNMQYDLYYLEHRSPTLYLAIMMMTPFVMMARDRAI